VYLGHGIWARREVEPACQIADLPPIDLIVLSHYHGDHFDDVAAQELDKKLPIVSTADAVDKLKALGFERGYPLDTWESLEVHKGEARLNITAMPGKHATDEAVNELLMPVNGRMLTSAAMPITFTGSISPGTRCLSTASRKFRAVTPT
jgi:L-ascorbate metabolism protein UlaG (beta-lactamase superfamily)